MSTILTDDELGTIQRSSLVFSAYSSKAFGRAVEAAVLGKLAQQEPVASVRTWHKNGDQHAELDDWGLGLASIPDGTHNLYAHPAPQQADRQRVPDEWRMALELFVSKKRNTEQANIAAELVSEFERLMTLVAAPSLAEQSSERHLRRLLAVRVGMPNTYYDDGEAQGYEHGISIDFMREPAGDIEAKLRALNVARAAMLAAAPEAPAQADHSARHLDMVPAQAGAVDERAEFEAWVTDLGVAMHYEGDGHYGNATVARWWEAWQARAAMTQKGGAA